MLMLHKYYFTTV